MTHSSRNKPIKSFSISKFLKCKWIKLLQPRYLVPECIRKQDLTMCCVQERFIVGLEMKLNYNRKIRKRYVYKW